MVVLTESQLRAAVAVAEAQREYHEALRGLKEFFVKHR